MVTLQLRQIDVQPGQCLILREINWGEFEAILEELGEHRGARVAYYQRVLEIRMPLPEHEKAKILIGEFVKILLDELEIDWEPYGSSTFKRQEMAAGLEPDDCFYIQNAARMIGKNRLNLSVDPPPDLAIEIDVTSKTQLSAYEALGVPELWCYADSQLQIFLLREGEYVQVENSPTFGDLPVIEGILQFLKLSEIEGASAARRGFRQWLRSLLGG
ncbi:MULTISPECIES: Uma2 family endonuclease [Cyanophyceae]|uniref:Uma2 family endonuclease n=2 Tax=Cyanobacteriota TaxID=1117 RepID=UPI00232BDAE3|nr:MULTISPECIES: Uma2 family endonuclease [Cyanophyceae]MDB9316103.1 Uma2 family endonuclease [Nodularia spumigena CS-590/01A]MDB9320547.1 Uma2 family endonuclease [Nodularia spumigena CS-591/07A]MDB9329246.1 Uma2 family endonuclease [Nodularia spumigena CS-591/04]MDB9333609.1 Uma2 family endonuclease [Nodularia spumigena CS-590/01]MDB9399952.1 Uma2 family endonuclease [Microcystis aeruginosa CS-567/02-A1]